MKKKVLLGFNKKTGVLICQLRPHKGTTAEIMLEEVDKSKMNYKLVEIDLDTEVYDGDYKKGKIKKKSQVKPTITEAEFNSKTSSEITEAYPLHRQLNILRNALVDIEKSLKVKDTSAIRQLKEMHKTISDSQKTNTSEKKEAADSKDVDYITKRVAANREEKRLRGIIDE